MRRPFILCAVSLIGVLAASPSHAQSGGPGQSALNEEMRMSAIEDQMRDLNGRIEELNNSLHQLKDQLDRLSSDVDLRFKQMQGQGASGPSSLTATGAPAATSRPSPPEEPRPSQSAGDMSRPPTRAGTLGTVGGPSPRAAAGPNQQTAAAGADLPEGSAQEQYNYAMGLLTQANYPAAEQAMRSFVQRWPNDPLAGNAQYWLGETFYVRKDYANAATAFAQGYEKYPKGSKAADDLLKLGMSLANLNQKADACRAYARLQHDFPLPPQAVRDRLASEKQRAGCPS